MAGKTVVIADDDPIIVEYLALRCRHLGLKVETATDGLRAVLKVGKARPDLLILDLNLPDVEGFRVVERLSDPKFSQVPILMLTGSSDKASKQRCEELNVYYVHKGADSWTTLEPLIYDLLLHPPEEPEAPSAEPVVPNVLLVDDDPVVLQGLTHKLQKYGLNVWQASGGTEGYLMVLSSNPDIVVTDYNMEHGSGHYLLSRIKGSPSTQHIPVIVYTATVLTRGEEAAIQRDLRGRGQAAAFLPKSANADDLVSELRKHIAFPTPR